MRKATTKLITADWRKIMLGLSGLIFLYECFENVAFGSRKHATNMLLMRKQSCCCLESVVWSSIIPRIVMREIRLVAVNSWTTRDIVTNTVYLRGRYRDKNRSPSDWKIILSNVNEDLKLRISSNLICTLSECFTLLQKQEEIPVK